MKKLLILLAAGMFIQMQLAKAQTTSGSSKKNLWRSEVGYAFTGSGDIDGYCIHVEYARALSDKFWLAPGLSFMNFHNNISFSEVNSLLLHLNTRSYELNGYYMPVDLGRFQVELGAGVFFRDLQWVYATGPGASFGNGEDVNLESSEYAVDTYGALGYTFSIGTAYYFNDAVGINLRGVYQNDVNGDNAVSARLGFNIKF